MSALDSSDRASRARLLVDVTQEEDVLGFVGLACGRVGEVGVWAKEGSV